MTGRRRTGSAADDIRYISRRVEARQYFFRLALLALKRSLSMSKKELRVFGWCLFWLVWNLRFELRMFRRASAALRLFAGLVCACRSRAFMGF
jgi:hypothetical protein